MVFDNALDYRRRYRGLLGIQPKVPLRDTTALSVIYTPGVARPCEEIAEDHFRSFDLTLRGNSIAVISDGSSVYGLGNVGPHAAIPMLEAKCAFHKTFAGIDAFPIAIDATDPDEFVEVVRYLSPTFGGFHIEDVASPKCFEIEERLKRAVALPIFHGDQQGSAVVVFAALINALKIVDKQLENLNVVIAGAGAAGVATAKFLKRVGVGDVKVCDRHGAIYYRRMRGLNWVKAELARLTNPEDKKGPLEEIIKGADVFIGLSAQADLLTPEMVRTMGRDPIILALSVPKPEISYEAAKEAGARIVALGGSDRTNQLNSSLVYPGMFRGALDVRANEFNHHMFYRAAEAMASLVSEQELAPDFIVPKALDLRISAHIAKAVAQAALDTNAAQKKVEPASIEEKVMTYVYEGTNAWVKPLSKKEFESLGDESVELHRRYNGVIETTTKIPIKDHYIYNLIYSAPGAAEPCRIIAEHPDEAYELTMKNNLVAVVTDGSAVLGLGDLGPSAALPVMEGKAVLFKTFGGAEAFPICLRTQDVDAIVDTVIKISPVFGGINLEDISAPRCFDIEQRLVEALDIPVFHDDQHGTAVVVLAGIFNAVKAVNKKLSDVKIAVNGAGASALSVSQLLLKAGIEDITICDTKGAIHKGRKNGMNPYKERIAEITNLSRQTGQLADVVKGCDIFIGLSVPNTLSQEMVKTMAKDPIIFALANPTPEIMPDEAFAAGAKIVATGRSDFPNQVNNSLAFPGIFRGAMDVRAKRINVEMKLAAANAIASLLTPEELAQGRIIPGSLDFRVPPAVAAAVAKAAVDSGESRHKVDPEQVYSQLKSYLYEGELKKIPHAAV